MLAQLTNKVFIPSVLLANYLKDLVWVLSKFQPQEFLETHDFCFDKLFILYPKNFQHKTILAMIE